ncbi:hypothetical protein N7474_008981 [Penicillium riverlandense]|uniref:uncharacterized protein n=1 Tax=Penicillium riverlandense TaxID=1903569 RepID=UPI0025468015|nr:uncharacterized protein N7474_008981 [Penicillium riverlandense]KAJ5812680.1 hypothetical protein N7474_008981 [Penicillium riverlandense]
METEDLKSDVHIMMVKIHVGFASGRVVHVINAAAASHVASPEVPDVPAVTATTNAAPQASSARSHSYSYTNEPVFCDVPDHIVTEAVEIFARKFPEFSFIHIADFLDQLRTSQRRSLVIKLAAIFALCARFIPSISSEYNNWNATSQDFATFVQQNLWPQIVQEPEIEMVHCLLLIAQYEWGEGNSFSAWMYTGKHP